MSTAQGKAFVVLLATVPPALFLFRSYLNPLYLAVSSKALLLLYFPIPYLTSPLRHLPQPPGEKLLSGHLTEESSKPAGSAFRRWVDTVPNSGLIYFRGLLQGFPRLLLTTPEALQEVLITHAYDYGKARHGRVLLSRTTGQGLVVVEGHEHKVQRKSVAPAFSGKPDQGPRPAFLV